MMIETSTLSFPIIIDTTGSVTYQLVLVFSYTGVIIMYVISLYGETSSVTMIITETVKCQLQ